VRYKEVSLLKSKALVVLFVLASLLLTSFIDFSFGSSNGNYFIENIFLKNTKFGCNISCNSYDGEKATSE
jgi:hypothetical protein